MKIKRKINIPQGESLAMAAAFILGLESLFLFMAYKKGSRIEEGLWAADCCLILYFAWVIRKLHKAVKEKQDRLDLVSCMYDVGKSLFADFQKEECVETALQKIASAIRAEHVFFIMFHAGCSDIQCLWSDDGSRKFLRQFVRKEREFFRKEFADSRKRLLLYDSEIPEQEPQRYNLMLKEEVCNLAAVPVRNAEGNLLGVLGAVNIRRLQNAPERLESMSPAFSVFCNNRIYFRYAKEMCETDTLTGLLNRNRYERDVPQYPLRYKKSLACIYIDADGLHEMNNKHGHEAGDRMLRYAADNLKEQFGGESTYRIGGDEFVVFVIDEAEIQIRRKIECLENQMEKEGYHVSVGVGRAEAAVSIDALIAMAEQEMYEKKKIYYSRNGKDRRNGR